MMEKFGYRVTTQTSSIEALETFTAHPDRFDLIITDIMMPRMDGTEFVRYVHDTDRYAKTKIIAITALHEDDPRVSAVKEAGVEKVVYKSCEDEDLIMTIREALGLS